MSLLIPNATINNLYHNGQKIKAAYFNGEKIWMQKHRVDWLLDDDAQTIIKTEYVVDGEAATPPVVQEWVDEFHSYVFSEWNTPYEQIVSDTNILAQSDTSAMYLIRNGYGMNSVFNTELGINSDVEATGISFFDNTSGESYKSIGGGSISVSGISFSHSGTYNANLNAFRAARYKAFQMNADALRAAGFSQLRFTGTYRFGAGEVYSTANLRVAFVSIQTGKTVSTNTASGVISDDRWQVRYHYNAGTSVIKAVSAVSGTINGTLPVPESGSFYVIVGQLTKAFKGTAELRIDNMWVE